MQLIPNSIHNAVRHTGQKSLKKRSVNMEKLSISSDEGLVPIRTIQQFAEDIGVVFPVSYVSLLSKHDHLYPKENIFNFVNHYGANDERDISFLGYKQNLGYEA